MSVLRISDIADKTGLSMRYWQRRAALGDIPGTSEQRFGTRRMYFVDAEAFDAWWPSQRTPVKPCPKTSRSAVASGTTGSSTKGARSKAPSIQRTLELLKNECAASSRS